MIPIIPHIPQELTNPMAVRIPSLGVMSEPVHISVSERYLVEPPPDRPFLPHNRFEFRELLRSMSDSEGNHTGWMHMCPGCQSTHWIPTENYHIVWEFNGNVKCPTFKPSVKLGDIDDPDCHYVITDGRIAYSPDCKHDLKGQTVDMVPFPEHES